jgi:ketosteroid isomerase-like protein
MKKIFVGLLLAVAVLAYEEAQKKGTPKETTGTAQALMDLENRWVDALTKADTATLNSIFVDTYVDTDEHSQRSDKQSVLAVLKSGDLRLESIKLSEMKVYDYGDAAVVTGSAVQMGNFKGQQMTTKVIFTDTFIRQNGKWRAVASHRSAV